MRQLLPEPIARVIGASDIDVNVARKNGKLLVHLVNTSGPHRTQPIIDTIAPAGPFVVEIRQPKKPTKITLEPSGQTLTFDYHDGKLSVTIPSIAIHEAIVVTD